MSKKSKSTVQPAKPAPKKADNSPKPAPVKVVKPHAIAKQQSGKPNVTLVKPLAADVAAKKQPIKGLNAGLQRYSPVPLKPVGKHMHWLADSRARDVLRVANDMPWALDAGRKGKGSLRDSLNSLLAHDLDLEEDDLREILTLRKKGRALFRQDGMDDETPEMPDPDETVAMNAFYNEWAFRLEGYRGGDAEAAFRQWLITEFLSINGDFKGWDTADLIRIASQDADLVNSDWLQWDESEAGRDISIPNFIGMMQDFDRATRLPNLVMVDLDPNGSLDDIASQLPTNVDGRPVLILMHGTLVDRNGAHQTYEQFSARWSNVPLDQQPVVIGVSWDSTWGPLLEGSDQGNLDTQAQLLGGAIDQFMVANRPRSISIFAHSLGTVLAENVVENSTTTYQTVLLLQGALTNGELQGSPLLDEERVETLVISQNPIDHVLYGVAGSRQNQIGLEGFLEDRRDDNVINLDLVPDLNITQHFGLETENTWIRAILECSASMPPGTSPEELVDCAVERIRGSEHR